MVSDTPSSSNQNVLKVDKKNTILIIIFLLIILSLAILVFSETILQNILFPKKNTITTPSSYNNPYILKMTPQPRGDSFNELVTQEGSNIALTAINGRIHEIVTANNGDVIMYVAKTTGELIPEPFVAAKDARVILVENKKEAIATVNKIKKDDLVIISYNFNTEKKAGFVASIRVTR